MKSAQSKTTTMRRHRSQRAATDTVSPATSIAQRVGFTLVELLMVIVIIGILISMLVVAVNPVLQRSREFAVSTEMKQMNLAIENFQNKYGFYPPSFTGFLNTPDGVDPDPAHAAQLLPFLNKISPNHREATPGFLGGLSRLEVWWNGIGSKLDDRSSLVFWLNGLGNNKQFPITGNFPVVGGDAQLPVIFNADLAILVDPMNGRTQRGEEDFVDANGNPLLDANGNPVSLERDALYDFNGGQLSDEFFDSAALPAPGQLAATGAGIRVYNQAFGNAKFDLAYRYRNAAFYGDPQGTAGIAFHINTDGTPPPVFFNPDTFQISTLGLDGRVSGFASTAVNQPSTGTVEQRQDWQTFNGDNIANFANGRLDAFDWTEEVELGNRNPE